jgi:hypothetical protein
MSMIGTTSRTHAEAWYNYQIGATKIAGTIAAFKTQGPITGPSENYGISPAVYGVHTNYWGPNCGFVTSTKLPYVGHWAGYATEIAGYISPSWQLPESGFNWQQSAEHHLYWYRPDTDIVDWHVKEGKYLTPLSPPQDGNDNEGEGQDPTPNLLGAAYSLDAPHFDMAALNWAQMPIGTIVASRAAFRTWMRWNSATVTDVQTWHTDVTMRKTAPGVFETIHATAGSGDTIAPMTLQEGRTLAGVQ